MPLQRKSLVSFYIIIKRSILSDFINPFSCHFHIHDVKPDITSVYHTQEILICLTLGLDTVLEGPEPAGLEIILGESGESNVDNSGDAPAEDLMGNYSINALTFHY